MISILFPTLALEGSPWLSVWKEKERRDFIRVARVVFPAVAVGYLANYFFFDLAVRLKPESLWLTFRVSMAAIACLVGLFYFSRRAEQTRFYKVPALVASVVFCYFQGKVLEWYSPDIYIYVYAFIVLTVVTMRTSVLLSLSLSVFLLAIVWPSFIRSGIDAPLALSGGILTLVTVFLLRSSYASEVAYFYSQQSNLEAQKKIVELNVEFSERIRTFLPQEITSRMDEHVNGRQMSIFQAAEEVMRPRSRSISCLFSDIRGFTSATKSVGGFVSEGVLPNVKECTKVIELERGIPRKIGDLIFAYFDLDKTEDSLIHCIRAAARVIDSNRLSNALIKFRIRRHVLVASGTAVVGNLGGFDSSVEITALGDPVNFLARLDETTKVPILESMLSGNEVVLDELSARRLRGLLPSLDLTEVDLEHLSIRIRDFPEVTKIFVLELTKKNRSTLGVYEELVPEMIDGKSWDSGYDRAISQLG
jgi:class 3 adenylate cyclase